MRRLLLAFTLLLLFHPPLRAEEAADWDDDAFLAEALDKACTAVEEVCEAKFPERPKLAKTTEAQLAEILEKEMRGIFQKFGANGEAGARNMAKALASALAAKYEPATRTIHVSPTNIRRLTKMIGKPELASKDMLRVLLMHEAAHALDFLRFPSLETERQTRETQEGIQAVGAVLEGHAQFVAEEAAKRAGLDAGFKAFTAMVLSRLDTDDPAQRIMGDVFSAEIVFAYGKGHTFARAVFDARGRKGLDAVLAAPPQGIREIERPALYLDPSSARKDKIDFDPVLEKAKAAIEKEGLRPNRQRFPTTTLSAVYRPLGAERAEALVKGYEDGWTAAGQNPLTGGLVAIAFLAFTDDAAAALYIKELEALLRVKDEQLEASPTITVKSADYSQGVGKDAKRAGIHCRKVIGVKQGAAEMEQIVMIDGTRVGRVVIELTTVQLGWEREKADGLLESLATVLEGEPAQAKELVGSGK